MLGSPPVTKFTPPRLPATLVGRDALVEGLETGANPVTLVTGFAGAEKTVLLTTWMAAHPQRRVAWLSCDSWDGDAERYWTSVVTALRQISADIGADALDWIGANGDATVDFVAWLVNDLARLAEPTVLVIDDLHVVPPTATRGLTEFLERLPPRIRVVIGTRSDPMLPLHRWRVNERLAELRDADLGFEASEVDALLHAFGVEIAAEDVRALTIRTEGWAAGVQLAALSLRGLEDLPSSSGCSTATNATAQMSWSEKCSNVKTRMSSPSSTRPPSSSTSTRSSANILPTALTPRRCYGPRKRQACSFNHRFLRALRRSNGREYETFITAIRAGRLQAHEGV